MQEIVLQQSAQWTSGQNQRFIRGAMKWTVITVVSVTLGLVTSLLNTVVSNVARLQAVLDAWEAKSLHASTAWRMREYLAGWWWLGPFRPHAPMGVLQACGTWTATNLWSLILNPYETSRRLQCLENYVMQAEEEHNAFKKKAEYALCSAGVLLLGLLVIFISWAKVCCWKRRLHKSSGKPAEIKNVPPSVINNGNSLLENIHPSEGNSKVTQKQIIKECHKNLLVILKSTNELIYWLFKHVASELLYFITTLKSSCNSSVFFFLRLVEACGQEHPPYEDFVPASPFPDFDALTDDESLPEDFIPKDSLPDIEDLSDAESVPGDLLPQDSMPDFDALSDEESDPGDYVPQDSMPDFDASTDEESNPWDFIPHDSMPDLDDLSDEECDPGGFIPQDFNAYSDNESVPKEFIPEDSMPDLDTFGDDELTSEDSIPKDSMLYYDALRGNETVPEAFFTEDRTIIGESIPVDFVAPDSTQDLVTLKDRESVPSKSNPENSAPHCDATSNEETDHAAVIPKDSTSPSLSDGEHVTQELAHESTPDKQVTTTEEDTSLDPIADKSVQAVGALEDGASAAGQLIPKDSTSDHDTSSNAKSAVKHFDAEESILDCGATGSGETRPQEFIQENYTADFNEIISKESLQAVLKDSVLDFDAHKNESFEEELLPKACMPDAAATNNRGTTSTDCTVHGSILHIHASEEITGKEFLPQACDQAGDAETEQSVTAECTPEDSVPVTDVSPGTTGKEFLPRACDQAGDAETEQSVTAEGTPEDSVPVTDVSPGTTGKGFLAQACDQAGDAETQQSVAAECTPDDSLPNTNEKSARQRFIPQDSIPQSDDESDEDAIFPDELLLRPRGAVLTFLSRVVDPPATLVMGTDKYENDHLISQATKRVVFFHVEDLPSAHVYLQLEAGQGLRDVPRALLQDAAQLCKANSAQGNRLSNVVIMYTLGSNLRKEGHMKAGEVSFASTKDVHRMLVARRDEAIMERLNRTKRKVASARLEREKQQKALQRQKQKANIKEQRRQQRLQQQKCADGGANTGDTRDTQQSDELLWGIEPDEAPPGISTVVTRGRRRMKKVDDEDSDCSETTQANTLTQITRCFPVGADQRRALQHCRALLEHRHDVRVALPKKGATDDRGTVTGAAEDVVEALAELKNLLSRGAEPAQPQNVKAKKAKDKPQVKKNAGRDSTKRSKK